MAMPHVHEDELKDRFAYHPPSSPEVAHLHEDVRTGASVFAVLVNNLPGESREKSLALTKVQEAMWAANAHVAIHCNEEIANGG